MTLTSQSSFGTRRKMFAPASKYYDLNRMLLLISGLWPYQRFKFRCIPAVFFLAVVSSFIVLQLMTFIKRDCSVNLVTKVLSIVLPMIVCVIKHSTFFLSSKKMKHLMDLMWYHWTIVQDKQEIAILERYTRQTRRITFFFLHAYSLCVFIVTIFHVLPVILDVIAPLNSTRPRRFYILVEYFFDEEKYFFLILLHVIATMLVGSIIILSAGCMFLAYVVHACAMLNIARHCLSVTYICSYRIRDVVIRNSVEAPSSQKYSTIHERIISGVYIHRKAMEFVESIFSNIQMPFSILLAVGVTSLPLNLFQVFIALTTNNVSELLTSVILLSIQFCYLYVGNYVGQIVTDHYDEIFNATYLHSYWYMAPLRSQRLLLFIMQRTSKNFSFVFAGTFVVSLKGFSTIASMSISYFTMIYTIYSK